MQLLRGINHHLLTSHADLLNPGENLKVLWMIVEAKRKQEESEKKKKVLEYELLPLSWGVYGAIMSWQLIVPVGFLNAELRRIVSGLFSCVQACRQTKRKEEKSKGCEGELPIRLFFSNISFLLHRLRPYGKTTTHLHTHTLSHRLAQHPAKWPSQNARNLPAEAL